MASAMDAAENKGGLTRRHAMGLLGTAGAGAAATQLLGAAPEAAAAPMTAPGSGSAPVERAHRRCRDCT
ncbi:hypothetical protein ACFQ0G_03860 [Streptomyces chiangmaiensis]